jgi:putative transposase
MRRDEIMDINIDAKVGEFYAFPKTHHGRIFRLLGRKVKGALVFTDEDSGRRRSIKAADFAEMRGDGNAVRVSASLANQGRTTPNQVDPGSYLDPNEPGITRKECKARIALARTVEESRSLFLAITHWDRSPPQSKHVPEVRRWRKDLAKLAAGHGIAWIPSASALQRARQKYGTPGDRSLSEIIARRRKHAHGAHWEKIILDLRRQICRLYRSDRNPAITISEPLDTFELLLHRANERRAAKGQPLIKAPSREAVRTWIHEERSADNWALRYNKREALLKYGGRGLGLRADAALDKVVIDHTVVDAFAVVKNAECKVIARFRPTLTLATDVFSRMVVGAYLSFEPPSLVAVMECLKSVVRRKDWLVQKYGDLKGSTDGWAKPTTLIVDNGWEFAGLSFRVACESAGIEVEFAPVRTPEYKAIGERIFRTLNAGLWHRMPGGVRYGPKEASRKGYVAEEHAAFDLGELKDRFWAFVATVYHLRVHRGIKKAPALAFRQSLLLNDRPTIDDVNAFEGAMGTSERRSLTATGIQLYGQRFHDPVVTGALLDDMLRYASVEQLGLDGNSGTVSVHVVWTDDASHVHVWNARRKRLDKLPNWNSAVAPGTSWEMLRLAKAEADARNVEFNSRQEELEHLDRFRKSLEPNPEPYSRGKKKRTVRLVHQERARLANIGQVEEVFAPSSASGMKIADARMSMAALDRTDNMVPPKDARRGGSTATAKAKATRKANASRRVAQLTAESAPAEGKNFSSTPASHRFRIEDPAAFMAALTKSPRSGS